MSLHCVFPQPFDVILDDLLEQFPLERGQKIIFPHTRRTGTRLDFGLYGRRRLNVLINDSPNACAGTFAGCRFDTLTANGRFPAVLKIRYSNNVADPPSASAC
jgi:hypothetical protein